MHNKVPTWKTLVIFLSLVVSWQLRAQQPVFRHFSVDEGLPSSEVYQAIQDESGFMWFATDKGLSKYDGHTFRNYSTDNGLPDNSILGFDKDLRGRIWLRYFSGKLGYIYKQKIFEMGNFSSDKLFLYKWVVDRNDVAWHLRQGNLSTYGYDLNRKKLFALKGSDEFNNLIYFVDPQERVIRRGPDSISESTHFDRLINYKIFYDRNRLENLAIGGSGNQFQIKPDTFLFCDLHNVYLFTKKEYRLIHTFPGRMLYARSHESGKLVFGVFKDGVRTMRFNSKTLKLEDWVNPNEYVGTNHILKGLSVTNEWVDNEGGIWYTTLESGVFYCPSPKSLSFTTEDGLGYDKVFNMIRSPQGELYIALDNGGVEVITKKGIQALIKDPQVSGGKLFALKDGRYWYAHSNGVSELVDHKITDIRMGIGNLQSIAETSDSTLWLGDVSSLFEFKKNGQVVNYSDRASFAIEKGFLSFKEFFPQSKIDRGIAKMVPMKTTNMRLRPTAICEYKGKIYVGSLNGLYTFDGNFHLVGTGKSADLLSSRVSALQTQGDIMWVVTRGSGVLMMRKDKIVQISEKDGLSSNLCSSFYIENDSTLWVGTNKGVNKIIYRLGTDFRYKIRTFETGDGLISAETNDVLAQDGYLWVATNKGLSIIDLSATHKNFSPPPVYFKSIRADTLSISADVVSQLDYQFNSVNFKYEGVAFRKPGKLRFKFMLEGLDTTWRYTVLTERTYSNLRPGKYTFKVYAINSNGAVSATPAACTFIVCTPWYRSVWFIMVCVVLVLFVLFVFYRIIRYYLVRKSAREAALNKKIAQIELKALQAQMNPHFIFNALNSIQKFISRNDQDSAYRYLSKFGSLIRRILNHSGKEFISLEEEVNSLKIYLELEQLRMEDRLDYSITVDENLDRSNVLLPSMLIQPFVENAIWHGIMPLGIKGKVEISFTGVDKGLRCVVKDNGIGRKRSHNLKSSGELKHHSIGMRLTEERLNILSLTEDFHPSMHIIDIDEVGSTGTIVEIIIPLKYEFE